MSRLGPYELIDRFAVGGVAEIYRAKDTRTGEIVVIKRMRSDRPVDPASAALRDTATPADEKVALVGLLGRTGAPRAQEIGRAHV